MQTKFSALTIAYIAILITFGVLDGLWLGVIAMPWYQSAFEELLREPFITWPWITFYLLYGLAVVYLAVKPNIGNVKSSFLAGAALGATAYGTYNLTGYSIIEGWPLNMTMIDWTWGTVATAINGFAGAAAANWWLRRRSKT